MKNTLQIYAFFSNKATISLKYCHFLIIINLYNHIAFGQLEKCL